MALTSALYTGLSGLDVNQTKLNVVGNNIANVNTTAFKSSRVLFTPQFYVTDAGGSPPTGDFGGTNPSQRGLGAQVASIEKNLAPGSIEATGRATDMAIDGDGYFIVQGKDQQFTRDGSFTLNSANQLVTTSGEFVQGYGVDNNFAVTPGTLTNITIPIGTLTTAQATSSVQMEGNLDASGTVASGASILTSQLLTVAGTGTPPPTDSTLLTDLVSTTDPTTPLFTVGQTFTLAGTKGGRSLPSETYTVSATSTLGGTDGLMAFFQKSMGINTDPSISGPPTPGVTIEPDATDTNSARIVVAGNTGTENALALPGTAFQSSTGTTPFDFQTGTNAAGDTNNPTGESVHTSFVAYDSLGTPVTVNVTAVFEQAADTGNVWRFYAESPDATNKNLVLGTGTLTFNNEGKLIASTGDNVSIDRANTGAKTPLSVKLDFGRLTSLTSTKSDLVMTKQDGSAYGSLSSFSISADGTIVGSFSNGLTRDLGQIALATFNNPQGLVDKGGNMYETGASSGIPIITTPQAMGTGAIRSGALEGSNVDLSEEFINLIVATTGFSASSRVISTSNQLITDLLNSTR